jgi:dTMP kinase
MLNEHFVSRMPDVTFWLDAPIELGMDRARARGALDRFEQEKVTFFEKVRSGYASLESREPTRVKRLDATQSPEQVFVQAMNYL